jgi:hypothetical protein
MPEERQAELAEWLLSGMPLHAAREAVSKQFGVVCSLASLSRFYQLVCVPVLLRRRSQAVAAAEEVAEAARSTPGRFDAATIDAIQQKAFELAISPMSSAKDVKAMYMLLQKSRDQEIKERQVSVAEGRLKMLQEQMARVQEAVSAAKRPGGLTPEALAKIEEAAKLL